MIYSTAQDLFLLKIYFDDSAYNKTFLGYGRYYQMQRFIRNPSLKYISNRRTKSRGFSECSIKSEYLSLIDYLVIEKRL